MSWYSFGWLIALPFLCFWIPYVLFGTFLERRQSIRSSFLVIDTDNDDTDKVEGEVIAHDEPKVATSNEDDEKSRRSEPVIVDKKPIKPRLPAMPRPIVIGTLCQNALAALTFKTLAWQLLVGSEDMERRAQTSIWPFSWSLRSLAWSFVIADSVFYWSHRLLHHPYLYKRIHGVHHKYRFPTALTAVYCHPLEMVLCNTMTILVGPLVTGMCPVLMAIWAMGGCLYTQLEHHGYQLVPGIDPSHHDQHHQRVTGNYGLTRGWDLLCQTMLPHPAEVATGRASMTE